MINKKKYLSLLIISGLIISIVGLLGLIFLDKGEIISRLFNLMFALGCGLIGGGIGSFYKIKRIEKTPGKSKQMEIEYNDERNKLIRDMANAKAGDISNWLVLLVAYICIIIGYPMWLVLLLLGVFLIKYILWVFFINKYNKEF